LPCEFARSYSKNCNTPVYLKRGMRKTILDISNSLKKKKTTWAVETCEEKRSEWSGLISAQNAVC
jgi:hypothetical protein